MANITFSNYKIAELLASSALTAPAQTIQPVAISGSNGSFAYSTATFGNLNGASFYTSNGSIVASYTVPSTAGLISRINVSAGATSNNISALTFSNANNVTFGLSTGAGIGTITGSVAAQTVQPVAVSGSNGSQLFSTLSMGNLNGLSHYISNGSIVGSYIVPPNSIGVSTGGSTSGNTGAYSGQVILAGNNITLSVSSGAAGAQTITMSAPATSSLVGTGAISISVNGSTISIGAQSLGGASIGVSTGGNTLGNTGTYTGQAVFAGGNNITLSVGTAAAGAQTITIVGGGGGGVGFGISTMGNTAGATGTVTTGNVLLVGSGPISLAQATGAAGSAATITINGPAISSLSATGLVSLSINGSTISVGASVPALSRTDFWPLGASTSSALTQGSASFKYLQLDQPVTFSRIDIPVLVSLANVANANTADLNFSSGLVIYSRNGSTLSPIMGTLASTTLTWASNSSNYSNLTGGKNISFAINGSLSPGDYWVGFQLSTTNNSSIGTATTLLGNSISLLGAVSYTASQIGDFGNTYSQSQHVFTQGIFSSTITATNQTIALSNISATGAAGQEVQFPIIFRNY